MANYIMKFKRRRVWSSILIGLGSSTSIIDNGWSYIVGEHMLHTWFHYYFLFISCVLFLSCSVQTPYLLVVSFQAWHVRYAHDMSIEECVEMPTHNLDKTMHNMWLQQYGNKLTCLYETIVDCLHQSPYVYCKL